MIEWNQKSKTMWISRTTRPTSKLDPFWIGPNAYWTDSSQKTVVKWMVKISSRYIAFEQDTDKQYQRLSNKTAANHIHVLHPIGTQIIDISVHFVRKWLALEVSVLVFFVLHAQYISWTDAPGLRCRGQCPSCRGRDPGQPRTRPRSSPP